MERNSAKIDDEAARWLQRRESAGWMPEHDAQLELWLEASTFHRTAFLRLEAAWEEAGRLHALAPGFERGAVPAPEDLRLGMTSSMTAPAAVAIRPVRGIGRAKWMTLAASFTVTMIAALTWYLGPIGETYATPVGGLASIPLNDGTSVALNTGSEIRVRLSKTERHVELERGEAFFDVAQDALRPFSVTAADKVITAIGTAFSVRRNGDEVQVVVTEGRVKVKARAVPTTAPAILSAGDIARTQGEALDVEEKATPQAEDLLSWRTGYLVFRNEPLTRVIAEFNRYSNVKIEISDPTIDSIQLTGKLRATNTEALLRLLQETFDVTVRRTPEGVVLASAQAKTGTE